MKPDFANIKLDLSSKKTSYEDWKKKFKKDTGKDVDEFIWQTMSCRQCVSILPLVSSSAASRPMQPGDGQEERRSREFLKQNTMF